MAAAPDPDPSIPPATPAARAVLGRLLRYARPHWKIYALGVVGMLISAASETGFAVLVKRFLDGTFVERDPDTLWLVPLGIVTIFFFRGLGDYVGNYCSGWVGRQVVKSLRGDLFRQYLDLPVAFYDRSQSGQLLSKLTYNTELVAEATTNAITTLVKETLTIVGLVGYLFYTNWRLTAFALVAAPAIAWLIQKVNRAFRRYASRIQESMGDVTRVAKESIDGQRLIKVFNAQRHEERRFEAANEHNRAQNVKLVNAKASSGPIVQLVSSIGLAAVMWIAIGDVLDREMTVGEFTSFLTALLLVASPLRRVMQVFGPLQQGITAGQSVFEVLDAPREPAGGTRPLDRARGAVAFEAVEFAYPGQSPALRGVSFDVRPGEKVAIVGRSGSGKSTLVGLVPRFHDATAGSVRLDGHDVRDYPLERLRANVSLVTQDVVLMDGTLRDNIAFATEGATPEAIEHAARVAHVLEFASELPAGLDTPVGDRGARLSGGQRQRIAIARAVLKDAPVLILDEATSALDTESERIVATALDRLMAGRTTLVIAHRLSTVENADRIVVLDEGRLVETGTHADLLARGGTYAALHRMQFGT